jgi:hypothetical protein
MEAAIWGLAGTVVGALASMGTTWLANRASQELQEARSRDERAERAREFQRQTLVDLQEAVHDAVRLVHRAYLEDRASHRTTKEWGKSLLSSEVDEGIRLALRRVSILVERVADDALRAEIKTVMSNAAGVLHAGDEEEAQTQLDRSTMVATAALERVGTVLRRHY